MSKAKPIQESNLHTYVKRAIEGAMAPHEASRAAGTALTVAFGEVVVWEEKPTLAHPHHTIITFYGNNRFQRGLAHYEGMFGEWMIDLARFDGPSTSTEEARTSPCTRTWGKARCMTPSDEWCESDEQRRARMQQWVDEGVDLSGPLKGEVVSRGSR